MVFVIFDWKEERHQLVLSQPRSVVLQNLLFFHNQVKTALKACLHVRFLWRQLDAIFSVALKLHQVSNMFETPAISRLTGSLKKNHDGNGNGHVTKQKV